MLELLEEFLDLIVSSAGSDDVIYPAGQDHPPIFRQSGIDAWVDNRLRHSQCSEFIVELPVPGISGLFESV